MKKRNDKENKAQAPLRERRSVPPSGKSGSAEDFALHLAAMFRAELGEDDGTLDPLLNWELPASEADFQRAAAKPEDSGELLRAVANFLSDEVPAETPAPPAKPRRAEREAARSSVPERPAPPEARPAPQPEPDRGSARRREQAEARPARTERRPAELVPEAPQEPRRRPGVEELFAAPGDPGASREGSRRPTAEELLADVVVSDRPREAARRPAARDRSAESVPEASRKNSRRSADERRGPESPHRAGKPPRRADETPAPRSEAPKPRAEAPTPPPGIEAASAPTAEAAESDRLVFFEPNRKKKSFFDALADRPASLPEEAPAAAAKRPAPLPEEAPERKPRKPADRLEASRDTAVRRSEKQRRPQSEEQNTILRSPRPDARRRSRTAARNTARVRVPADRVSEDPTQLVLPAFDATPFRPPQEDPPLEEIFAPLGLRTAPPTPDDTAVLSARATEKPAAEEEKPAKASKAGEPAAKGWFGKRSLRAKAEAEAEPQAQAPAPAEEAAPPAEAPSPAEEAAPQAEASPAPPAPEENAPAASPAAEAPLPDSRLTVLEPYADDPEALAAVEREIPGLAELLAHAGVSLGQTPTPTSAEAAAAPSDREDASDALRLTLPAFPQESAPSSASPFQSQAPADHALTLLFEEHGSRSEAGQPEPQPAGIEREAEPEQTDIPAAPAADSSRNADADSAPDAPAEAIPDRPPNAEASDELPAWAIFDHTQDAEPAPADGDAAPVPPQTEPAPSKAARPAWPKKRKRRWFSFLLRREDPEAPLPAEAPDAPSPAEPLDAESPAAEPINAEPSVAEPFDVEPSVAELFDAGSPAVEVPAAGSPVGAAIDRPPEAEPSDTELFDAESPAVDSPVGAAIGRPPEAEPSDTELFDAESPAVDSPVGAAIGRPPEAEPSDAEPFDAEPFDAEPPAVDSPVGAAIGRPPEAEPSDTELFDAEPSTDGSPGDADDGSSHWYTELLSEFLPEAPLSASAPELPAAEEAPDLTADLPNAVKAQENPAEAPAAAEAPDAIPDIFGPGAAAAPDAAPSAADAAPVPPSRPSRRARPEKRKHRWLSFLSGEATPARGNRAAETPPAADGGRQTAASVWDLDELLNPKPFPEPVPEDEAPSKLVPEDDALPALVPENETSSEPVPENEPLPEPVPEDEALPDAGAAVEAPSDAAAAPEEADAAEDSETPAEGGAPELWDPLSLFDEPADEGPPPLTPLSQDATDSLPTLEELFGAAPPSKPAAAPAARAPSPRRPRQEKRRGWFRRWRNGDSLPQRDAAAEDAAPASDAPADAPRNDAQAAVSIDKAYVGAAIGRPPEAEAFDDFSPVSVPDAPPEPEPADAASPVGAAIGRPPEAEAFDGFSPAGVPDAPPEPEPADAEPPAGAAIGRPPEAEAFDDFSLADVPDAPPEPEPPDAEPPVGAATGRPPEAEPFDDFSPAGVPDTPPEPEPADAEPPVGAAIGRPPEAEAFDDFSPADVPDAPPEPEPADAASPVGAAIGRPPEAEPFDDLSPADVPDAPPEPEPADAEPPVGAAIGRPPEAEAFDGFSPVSVPDAMPAEAEGPGQAAADEQSLEALLASIDALLQPLPGQTLDLDAPTGDAAAPAAPLAAVPPSDEAAAEETPGAGSPSDDWDPLALFGGQTDDAALPASWEDYLNSLRTPAPGAEPPADMTETEQADPADPDAVPDTAEAPSAPESPVDTSAATRRIDVKAPGAPAPEPEPTLESIFGKPAAESPEPETVPMDLREPERPAPQKKKRRRKSSGGALTLEDFLAAAVPMEETAPTRPETPPAQRKVQTRRHGPSGRDDTISTARENPEGLVLTRSEDRSAELPHPQAFGARPGLETPRPEEPTPSADARPPLKPGRAPKASRREIDVMPPEEKTVLHPEEAYRVYARPLDEIGSRLVLTGLFTILSLFFTLYLAQRWTFLPEIFSGGTTVYLLLALLGLMVLVNRKLYFREWRGAQGLRPELLIGAATLFTALDCFSAARSLRPPFTVVVGALLLVTLWGRYDRGLALLTTVKVLRNEKLSAGVGEVQDITKGSRGLIRTEPNVDRFMEKLETPDLTDRVLRWYTPVALVGGSVLTLLISLLLKQDFLWTGSLIFLGLVPVTGLLAYPRLFCLLSARLAGAQAALCGYHGAEAFGGEHAILIGDDDIFPAGSLTLNGFKVYSGNPDRIIAYAAAACRMSGSALDPVFEDLLVTHNGRHYTVDNFRFYDSGGIGASIQQDVVLMGSLDFMRRMGVHMDRGARVKQAVYMSLNGELAAVFAVRYAPPENLRRGLAAIAGNRHFKGILVTRTFLGTPSFLKVKFGIPTSAFQYPSTKERIRLSEAELKRTGAQGAILAQDSFSGFAQAAAGGRMLRSATLGAVILTLLGGAVGLVLMGVLAALPAYETATALNLLLYTAAWLAPTLLLTAWGRHF